MNMKYTFCLGLLQLTVFIASFQAQTPSEQGKILTIETITAGAERFIEDEDVWKNYSLGLVVNHSSLLDSNTHLVDALIQKGANIKTIFAPEHGFRGTASAGQTIKDGKDATTGLPVLSLYGKYKKPTPEMLKGVDLLVFDIQDVGARFYTYISTLYYVMQRAAELEIPLIVLDRPNPNGFYVDGPILDSAFVSFVGALPIPIVHGMTMGELALFIEGEGLLRPYGKINLQIVEVEGYRHRDTYAPPVAPSPNLPNLRSILLYPSLCYFEATEFSVGRGTDLPFQLYGHPQFDGTFMFTPETKPGAVNPKHKGILCHGNKLDHLQPERLLNQSQIDWSYFWNTVQAHSVDIVDRPNFLNLLMGTNKWMEYIEKPVHEWRSTYQNELDDFKLIRDKYLLYPN
jgi:uncharacterized protein YbbC (DUF1343 family)